MLFKSILSASFLLSACHAAPSSLDTTGVRIRGNPNPPVRDSMILSHLVETKGLKPEHTQDLGEGKYEEYFVVEPMDYDDAYSSLMVAGNVSIADIGFSNDDASDLQKRDVLYSALCYQEGTMGYAQTIGQIVPAICTGFTFAVGT